MWLDANVLFPFYNYGVMPFWVLLIALPRAQITNMLVHSGLMPCVLGVSYTVLLAVAVAGAPEGGGLDFGSIASIRAGFESDLALLHQDILNNIQVLRALREQQRLVIFIFEPCQHVNYQFEFLAAIENGFQVSLLKCTANAAFWATLE